MRRTYGESFALLKERIDLIGDPRPQVSQPPKHDDTELGPSIFRYRVEEDDFGGLTVPGLFIGRSGLIRISFAGSDLRLSTFNWSDFTGCDFSGCNLSGSDLRSCRFSDCSFRDADLTGADLRHSQVHTCDFSRANMTGAKLVKPGALSLILGRRPALSNEQKAAVTWSNAGPVPGGG